MHVCAQHCDSVIMKEDAIRWELSAEPVQLTSDEVTLSVTDGKDGSLTGNHLR